MYDKSDKARDVHESETRALIAVHMTHTETNNSDCSLCDVARMMYEDVAEHIYTSYETFDTFDTQDTYVQLTIHSTHRVEYVSQCVFCYIARIRHDLALD